jgi:hypothetical protein
MNTPTPAYRVYRQALAVTQLRRIIIGGLLLALMALATTATATPSYGDHDEQWDEVLPKRPMRWYILIAPEPLPVIRWRWV